MIQAHGLQLLSKVGLLFQLALLGFELSEGQDQAALGRLLMGILFLSAALLLRQMRFAVADTQTAALRQAVQRWRWLFWPAAVLGGLVLLAETFWWIWQGLTAGKRLEIWDLMVWVVLGSSLLLSQLASQKD
ncbi:MAG: hypothetical protein IGS03_06440 [Candidatus Sericytochromatia bacterium]|nr:hypothetical protein [Candidatus Sericytochromatia bacterium]